MKKTLRWMMLLGVMAICSIASAQTASDEYLDIATNATTVGDAGFKSDVIDNLYYYDETSSTLVISVYGAYQSAGNQKWVTTDGSGSSSREWEPAGVFKGSGYYHTTTAAKTATANTSRTYFFKVKGIKSVSALVKSGGKSRSAAMAVKNAEGREVGIASDNSNTVAVISVEDLDADEIYTVELTGTDSSNSDVYEVAFVGGNALPVIVVEEKEKFSFNWNFSNWALGDITEQTTVDGLTVEAASDKKVTIDGNSQTVDGVAYTQRLKFGGTGAAGNRNVHFEVPGSCTIKVIGCSASGSADRTLNIHVGSFGNVKGTMPMLSSGPEVNLYNYEGGPTTIYLASASSGVNLYAIYVEGATREINFGPYGVISFYFGETSYQLPEGVTAFAVDEVSGKMLNLLEVTDIIPAGCGVILNGEPDANYTFYKVTGDIPEQHSLLRGSDKTEETTGDDPEGSYKFYMLSAKNGNVGFYYGANGGAAFMNQANKAYLAVPMEDAAGITEFVFDGFDGITAVEAEPSTTSTATYNLAGQRVGADYKGVVISGNKKYIRK
jgi:hypothetical protein